MNPPPHSSDHSSSDANHSAASLAPDAARTAPESAPTGKSTESGWPKVARRLIHRGAKFSFEQLTLQGTDGSVLTREVVRHPGAVVIVPVLDRPGVGRQIVFIRNWRITLERWLDELPAGTIEPGEPPEICAARELEEETGFKAGRLVHLASFYTTPGMTDELMHAYVAFDLTAVGQHLELDERIAVQPRTLAETAKLISANRLADAKSLCALLLAAQRGLISLE